MIVRATFDDSGLPVGFYPDDIWPEGYPDDAVEISEDHYQEFMQFGGFRRWDGSMPVPYEPPQPEPDPQPEKSFTFLEFMDLFTPPERIALVGASMSDPEMKLWYDMALGAQGIFMSDPRTGDGVRAMAEANLITQDRAEAVLRGEAP